jgi:hypothetical protein
MAKILIYAKRLRRRRPDEKKYFLKKFRKDSLRKKTAQMALTFDSSFTRNDSGFKAALFHNGGGGLLGLVA